MSLEIKYDSQRVALPYFRMSGFVFGVQILLGLLAAAQFIWPQFMLSVVPFNISKEIHVNALLIWLLMGFMGITYYMTPLETEREIHSPLLAKIQFWAVSILTVTLVVLYLFDGATGHRFNVPFLGTGVLSEGREYIEAPRWADLLIVGSILAYLYNVGMTYLKGKKTDIMLMLLVGQICLAVAYLPGILSVDDISQDLFWRWWVIHYWVEGSWELIASAILCFLLMVTLKAPRRAMERWMWLEVALVMLTGLPGIGHHFFWIGTPSIWLWVGSIFSAMEPIPLLVMVWDAFRHSQEYARHISNRPALYWTVGHALFNFVGAGLWGVIHTLSPINAWTHGTQMTVAHGHLAFFGAFAMLIVASWYVAMPSLQGFTDPLAWDQGRGMRAFWWMTIAMCSMTLVLTGAAIVQVYLQRVLGMDFVTVKMQYNMIFWVLRLGTGAGFLWGCTYLWRDLFHLAPTRGVGGSQAVIAPAQPTP
ncbi:MAG TPA: cbb3-type cytochrome c oxidase subunit I [Oscillatoriaceae cyanobacterium]